MLVSGPGNLKSADGGDNGARARRRLLFGVCTCNSYRQKQMVPSRMARLATIIRLGRETEDARSQLDQNDQGIPASTVCRYLIEVLGMKCRHLRGVPLPLTAA
jgi:hypothetical protein